MLQRSEVVLPAAAEVSCDVVVIVDVVVVIFVVVHAGVVVVVDVALVAIVVVATLVSEVSKNLNVYVYIHTENIKMVSPTILYALCSNLDKMYHDCIDVCC